MGHPAKEGLRLILKWLTLKSLIPQSGSSSKRGIKTHVEHACTEYFAQSGSSSKREIKTIFFREFNLTIYRTPRVGHPAKEGLRLLKRSRPLFFCLAQSGSSSKRGIKTLVLFPFIGSIIPHPEWVIQQKRD